MPTVTLSRRNIDYKHRRRMVARRPFVEAAVTTAVACRQLV